MQEKIDLIKYEFKARNFDELGKLSHRIRSTSLNLGTTRLAEIFKRLEYLSSEQNILASEILLLIQSAEKEYAHVSEKLELYLQKKD